MSKTDELRGLVQKHGIKLPKRHGYHYIFNFPKEGTRLLLDTWNGALYYKVIGSTIPLFYFGMGKYWSGFTGVRQPENVVEYYITKLKNELARRQND